MQPVTTSVSLRLHSLALHTTILPLFLRLTFSSYLSFLTSFFFFPPFTFTLPFPSFFVPSYTTRPVIASIYLISFTSLPFLSFYFYVFPFLPLTISLLFFPILYHPFIVTLANVFNTHTPFQVPPPPSSLLPFSPFLLLTRLNLLLVCSFLPSVPPLTPAINFLHSPQPSIL